MLEKDASVLKAEINFFFATLHTKALRLHIKLLQGSLFSGRYAAGA
jgi:hypothetical protein